MSRPKLKICGINDARIAAAAEAGGADYLGFIFVPASPRAVTPKKAREIRDALAGRAKVAGVFTDAPIAAIAAMTLSLSLDVVQLHAPRSVDDVWLLKRLGFEVWRLDDGVETPADAVLLDGRAGNATGGTGQRADWAKARALKEGGNRVVLAGGLSAENLSEAVAATGADVFDVNSSLETAPGVKDAEKLAELLRVWRDIAE